MYYKKLISDIIGFTSFENILQNLRVVPVEKSRRTLRDAMEPSRIPKNHQKSLRSLGVFTGFLLGNLGKYSGNHKTNLEPT